MPIRLLNALIAILVASCGASQHHVSGGIEHLADMGAAARADERCLNVFTGPITLLDRDYGYTTTKVATWPDQARFDAQGGRWTSLMNGYGADGNRDNTAPVQFGVDWGTNIAEGRRDLWSAEYNTPPQPNAMCFSGGVIVGTQPITATWGETKRNGGGYAITVNGKGAVVEGARIHNHHDAFVPYRSDGFVFRDNWVSYTRDDCIENDGHAEGAVLRNLFDGCYVFYSGTNGVMNGAVGAGAGGTVRIEGNLVRIENMPGPYQRGSALGDRTRSGYGRFFKTRGRDDRVPAIIMRDNVLAFEVPAERSSVNAHLYGPHVRITDCANNTLLWFGEGSFPDRLPAEWEACFTIITGSEARERWDRLRQEWIDAHPGVARL